MPSHKPNILLVVRERRTARELAAFLERHGLRTVTVHESESALLALARTSVDALVAELSAPRINGLVVLARALELQPERVAVMIAGPGERAAATEAMRWGATDYQFPPLDLEKLVAVLDLGFARQRLAARAAELETRLDQRLGLERLRGISRAMQRVADQVRSIAASRATVLIEGEPGTGKSLVAQAIHQLSPRRRGPFVALDCGAFSEAALEGELFGVEAGAGHTTQAGLLERAQGGTMFLDGVAELPARIQIELLRVLHESAFGRVGGRETLRSDARIIAATDRDLAAEAAAGRFREDLFTRLSVVRIQLPPLRERREDIPMLAEEFLRELARERGGGPLRLTRGTLDTLARSPWPGNVRELRETIERIVVAAGGRRTLDLSDLPEALQGSAALGERLELAAGMTVEEAERQLIAATLRATGNDKQEAAALLGIGLRTLYRKLDSLSPPRARRGASVRRPAATPKRPRPRRR